MKYVQWTMMLRMVLLRERDLNLSQISSLIGVSRTNPYFLELMSTLFEKDIARVDKVIGSAKIVNINRRALAKLLKTCEVDYGNPYRQVKKYFEEAGIELEYSFYIPEA